MNLTDKFINLIYDMSRSPLSAAAETKAKQALLDYLGVTYGGAFQDDSSLKQCFPATGGECSVLGAGQLKTSALTAAFLNGFHAHILELDDGHRFGMLHLGAAVISAVLAVAQQEQLSFPQIIKGIVIGYEVAVRAATAMQPEHKKTGYHTTGTCGTIGAAMGCAAAMDLGREQMKSCLSAAAASSAGLLEIQENASQLKAYNVAHAAMSGVAAAMIGKTLLRGPDDILGGDRGFLAIHSKSVHAEKLLEKASYFEIQRIYVKPYAACRHCHSALEAVLLAKHDLRLDASQIRSICVDTYSLAIRGHDHTEIKGVQSAKLSMPYSVAAAYILDGCGVEAFTQENITDTDILELTKKVSVRENPEFTALSPGKRIAELTVFGNKGEAITKKVEYAKGDPENPLTEEEVIMKFLELMKWCQQTDKAYMLIDLFRSVNIDSRILFDII